MVELRKVSFFVHVPAINKLELPKLSLVGCDCCAMAPNVARVVESHVGIGVDVKLLESFPRGKSETSSHILLIYVPGDILLDERPIEARIQN